MSDYTSSHAIPSGIGLVLSIAGPISPFAFVEIGETKNVSGPTLKNETTDVTNVQSPGGVKEFKATLTDPGEVSAMLNYVPTDLGQIAVQAALLSKAVTQFQLTLPPSSVQTPGNLPGYWDFSGLITEFPPDIPLDKEATISLKIKVSGLPVYTPEAA